MTFNYGFSKGRPNVCGNAFEQAECKYSTAQPGLMVLAIDQSGSMQRLWRNTGKRRMEVAAEQVNGTINRVLLDCQYGNKYLNRIWIVVVGYSRKSEGPPFRLIAQGWPSDFRNVGGGWVHPEADGETPFEVVFEGSSQYLEQFFADPARRERFQRSAPPVIVNITDGEANEFRSGRWEVLSAAMKRLSNVKTPQGLAPLVFHAHISDNGGDCKPFPENAKGLDDYGAALFRMSSRIPDSWVRASVERTQHPIVPGAVGLILNSGPVELMDLLTLASVPNLQ